MRWIRAFGGLAVCVVFAAGCMKVNADITVEDDGSGEVTMLTAFDTDAMGELFGQLLPADELCSQVESEADLAELPAGTEIEGYDEDGFCGTVATLALEPATDHTSTIESFLDGESGSTRLYKEGDNWFFESGFDADEALNDADGFADEEEIERLLGESEVIFRVDLPGRAVDGANNATHVGDNGVFEWDIDILDPPSRLFAQTEPGSGGGSGGGGGLLRILVGLLVLGLFGAAAWWFLTQRNKGDDGASSLPGAGAIGTAGAAATGIAGTAASTVAGAAGTVGGAASTVGTAASTVAGAADGAPSVTGAATDAASGVTGAVSGAATNTAEDLASINPDLSLPVKPSHEAQETVAMSTESAQTDPRSAEPVWDPARDAWVIEDPTRGLLVHDTESNTWKPA